MTSNHMIQIRFHGRGGQGVVTAAEIAAIAAFAEGKQSQAFPSFGVERTGAPVEAYARIDATPIRLREQIATPDILVIQDASLITAIDITRGCNEKTKVIVNSGKAKEELGIKLPLENIFVVDATKIALEILGRNIVNTVILGAIAKATGIISIESLKKAITEKFKEKGQEMVDKNIAAIMRAYEG